MAKASRSDQLQNSAGRRSSHPRGSEKADSHSNVGSVFRRFSPQWRGRLLVVVAAVLWSSSGFFAKSPVFLDWPESIRGTLYAFWRSFFAAMFLLLFVRRIQFSWKLIPATLVFAAMNWAFLNAMVLCESTLAIWLQYSAPVWVFVGSWALFRESPIRRDWWLLLLATSGVGVILWNELLGASAIGVLVGLLAGLLFASVVLTLRWCRELDPVWVIFLNHSITSICFAPFVFQHGISLTVHQAVYLSAFGAFQIGAPYVLFATAVKSISNNEASSLTLLEPILVPVWVWLVWRDAPGYEPPALTTLIGGGLILLGLGIRFWPTRQQRLRRKP